MIRKTLTVFFLAGLVVSVGLFATSVWYSFSYIPDSLRFKANLHSGILWITWPDDAYPRLTREHAVWALESMSIPSGVSIADLKREFLTARPFEINRVARSGLGIRRERPNLSVLRYFSLRVKRVEHQKEYHISVGLWIPALICLSGLYFSLLHGRRRRRRRKLGLCLKCGYDLRGSAERCPECGEVIPCRD